jgi:hypothetical protein
MNRRHFLAAASAAALTSCGYHVAGKADLMPKSIQTIGIPPFSNPTNRYKLTEHLPIALTREFLTRTRYQILPDALGADAVLTGAIAAVLAFPTIFDPRTGRAAGVQIQTILAVTLTHQAAGGAVLYTNPALDFRQRYEISTDPEAYFDESTPAFNRLCRDVAASVVSAILEKF